MTHSLRLALTAIIVCCTFIAVSTSTSCKKDPCANTSCLNGGTCIDGKCKCPTGFEGEGCETDLRNGFGGRWAGPKCSSGNVEYLTIVRADSNDLFAITYDGYTPIYGKLTGDTLIIENQSYYEAGMDSNAVTDWINIAGIMTNKGSTIAYYYDWRSRPIGGGPSPDCNGEYKRQP